MPRQGQTRGRSAGPALLKSLVLSRLGLLLLLVLLLTLGGGSAEAAEATPGENCDLTVQGPVCLMNNRRILLPAANPSGLQGHWTFDDAWPTDASGNGLHSQTPANAGTGVGHSGFSGSFDRSEQGFEPVHIVDDAGRLMSTDVTVTFWLFVVRPPIESSSSEPSVSQAGADCAVFFKGNSSASGSSAAAAAAAAGSPSVFLTSKSRLGFLANGVLQHSQARLSTGRWTHVSPSLLPRPRRYLRGDLFSLALLHIASFVQVAIVRLSSETSLYVNGVLDSKVAETSPTQSVGGPLYIGGLPAAVNLATEGQEGLCDRVHVMLDEVKFYTVAQPPWAIEAEASPALGSVAPRFARLGCSSCSRPEAQDACTTNYHLCSETELFSGALQIARSLGYIDATTTNIWRVRVCFYCQAACCTHWLGVYCQVRIPAVYCVLRCVPVGVASFKR